jgi:hypothetical protein
MFKKAKAFFAVFLVALCLIGSRSRAAITFDAITSTTVTSGPSYYTLSFNCSGSTSTMLIVTVLSPATFTANILYNNVSATAFAVRSNTNGCGTMNGLASPSSGSNLIAVSFTSAVPLSFTVIAASYDNVANVVNGATFNVTSGTVLGLGGTNTTNSWNVYAGVAKLSTVTFTASGGGTLRSNGNGGAVVYQYLDMAAPSSVTLTASGTTGMIGLRGELTLASAATPTPTITPTATVTPT